MKKILITCLRNEADTIETAHFVSSYKRYNPKAQISLLCYQDYLQSADLIKGINHIYTIDRNKINHILNGELYSDAFAINSFADSLKDIFSIKWEQVINFSNDATSAYLSSIISTDEIIGTHISTVGSALTSNKWAMYQNFVTDVDHRNSLNTIDVRHHMAGIPYASNEDSDLIKIDSELTIIANRNFSKIRKSKNTDATIVGISLSHSESTVTRFSEEQLQEIIETLTSSESHIPILLTNGSMEEKLLINKINEMHNNCIISVNADITALPAVLSNIDILISQPNKVLSLAQCLDVPVIEIKTTEIRSSAFKEGNYSIYLASDNEDFTSDINFILNAVSGSFLPVQSKHSVNKTYTIVKDEYSTFRTLIRGHLDTNEEVKYNLQRCANFTLMGYPHNDELLTNLKNNVDHSTLHTIASEEREHITSLSKTLLTTIRSIKAIGQSHNGLEFFVENLDLLISQSQSVGLSASAVALFEGRVENIKGTDREENLSQIEKHLFRLKNDIHNLALIIDKMIDFDNKLQKDL